MRAADAVVLAMPMSPLTSRSAPESTSAEATAMPASMAASACARLIAGPWVMSAVPWATLCRNRFGESGRSVATPTSTTVTLAPICRARALTTAPPAARLATIWAVTSCGQGVTPCACTPWSAANTAIAGCFGTGGGQDPAMPASCEPTSSRRPMDPRGLVSSAWRASASAAAVREGGLMAARVWLSRDTGNSWLRGRGSPYARPATGRGQPGVPPLSPPSPTDWVRDHFDTSHHGVGRFARRTARCQGKPVRVRRCPQPWVATS